MAANQTAIVTDLAVDAALQQDANYRFDRNDRQYIDNQIRGVEQHLVDALILGVHATFVRVASSSSALVAGDCVCLSTTTGALEVTKALSAALSNAGSVFGVVILPAQPGAFALIAIGGALPNSLTGLPTASTGPVKVNPTSGRCQAGVVGPSDYGVGFLAYSGYLNVVGGSVGNPLASPTISGNINITGFTSSQTSSSDGKVIVNDIMLSFQTLDATQATAYSWNVQTGGHTAVDVLCTAVNSDATAGATYKRGASWRRVGGTVTAIGSTRDNTTDETSAGWDLTLDTSGTAFRVRVTGAASTTIRWGLVIRIQSTVP